MSSLSYMRKAFFFVFLILADKGAASSESALFETELCAFRSAKATFVRTLDSEDLKAATLASKALKEVITAHLTTYNLSSDLAETVESVFTAFELKGMDVAKNTSSAAHHYDSKATVLTTENTFEQEKALMQANFIYAQRRGCSLLAEKLEATHNFYYAHLQAIKQPEDTNAWQSFDRINTCLNELTAFYWTVETSLVHAIVVDPNKFSPLWGYWNDEEKAAQHRENLFLLGRANVLGYLFCVYDREQTASYDREQANS